MVSVDRRTVDQLLLALGFLALAVGVTVAYRAPASRYELSVYASTPTGYWVGVGLSVTLATIVMVRRNGRLPVGLGLGLGAGGVLAVLSLPIIRNYFFYGPGDSMSHLGWTAEIARGSIAPHQLLYPGLHLLTTFIEAIIGYPLMRSMLYVPMVILPLLFIVFTILSVRHIAGTGLATVVGGLVGMLFLPINLVSVHPVPHPSSQAILLLPFVVFVLLLYLGDTSRRRSLIVPVGVLLIVLLTAYVFFHPQESLSVIALLAGIAVVQAVFRRWGGQLSDVVHRSVYVPFTAAIAVFLIWIPSHPRAMARIETIVRDILSLQIAIFTETQSRGSSLVSLGGSFEELFLKLFLVSTVFLLIGGVLTIRSLTGRSDRSAEGRTLILYIALGSIPVGGLMGLLFLIEQGDHYFRFLGFLMVLFGVLGAVAIVDGVRWWARRRSGSSIAAILVVAFVVMLTLQGMALHPSPYIYQPSRHVTHASVSGYSIAFDHADPETTFMGVRNGPRRYVDAIYGRHTAENEIEFRGYREGVTREVFNTNLSTHYDEPRFLSMTTYQYRTEVDLYRGLRYEARAFERLEREPTVGKVHDNGDFELYRVSNVTTRS